MSDDNLYCIFCHILVRKVGGEVFLGKDRNPPDEYVHASLRSSTGDPSCGRRILKVSEVEHLTTATEA